MLNRLQGSIRLFRFSGIDVFLHWSWFLIALFEIQDRRRGYSSLLWNALEYLALFAIVLMHEFGHALACRQVGGRANRIVLWPLGGVAYVDPPPRAGATLWSIAAGPLVNLVLFPFLFVGFMVSRHVVGISFDLFQLIKAILLVDVVLLVFNLLPVYPLDGGQILRSLLWFMLGRARSLLVATIVGLMGIAGFFAFAVWKQSVWYGAMAVFLLMNCWAGLRQARAMLRFAKLPRRPGFACPKCKAAPPVGDCWMCGNCQQRFDMFEAPAVCPACLARYSAIICPECGESKPIGEWSAGTENQELEVRS